MASENPSQIKVKTTLPTHPFPSNSARPAIRTERLIIRPLTQDDFEALRSLRTQPEAICLASTGEFIGLGGVFRTTSELGWPEVGYMLKKEHWGRGYGTEFLKAFVQAWWSLPRSETETMVDALSVDAREGDAVPEMLSAMVESTNAGSLRIMKKAGFKQFKTWKEVSQHPGSEGAEVTLIGFVNLRPEK